MGCLRRARWGRVSRAAARTRGRVRTSRERARAMLHACAQGAPPCALPLGPMMVDTHSYTLSPLGPALQLQGGSRLISASSCADGDSGAGMRAARGHGAGQRARPCARAKALLLLPCPAAHQRGCNQPTLARTFWMRLALELRAPRMLAVVLPGGEGTNGVRAEPPRSGVGVRVFACACVVLPVLCVWVFAHACVFACVRACACVEL